MKIKFIDCDCPEAVDSRNLGIQPMGGTESTLLRVAEGLAARGHQVDVCQHNRTHVFTSDRGVRYLDFDYENGNPEEEEPDLVVTLRCYKILKKVRRAFPSAVLGLWSHCFPGSRWRKIGKILEENDAHLFAVSQDLGLRLMEMAVKTLHFAEAGRRVHVVYNPISDSLKPDPEIQTNPRKMVFFSSPHKGLEQVLDHFSRVRTLHPEMELYVADPGYWDGPRAELPDGVIPLGALPHHEILRHVQEAWCVFYPQSQFKETFGLIFAEANALGTPVIAHPFAAATEVLYPADEQTIDCESEFFVPLMIHRWKEEGTPEVQLKDEFRLTSVLDRWERLAADLIQEKKSRSAQELTQEIRPLLSAAN